MNHTMYCYRQMTMAGSFLLSALQIAAQSSGIPLNAPAYPILERLEIKTGVLQPQHAAAGFYHRKDAADYARTADSIAGAHLSPRDRADLQYLSDDNNEWVSADHPFARTPRRGLWGIFYKTPAHFFEVNTPDFTLRADPMFRFEASKEQGDNALLFVNQRGLEVRGAVDNKVFFYTNLLESQQRFPAYVQQRISEFSAIPGAGLYKPYIPRILDLNNAYDYYVGQAYIGLNVSKHVGLQLGHGQHFIGNGYRSFFLSDVGGQTFYLKLNTRVWKLQYQNLFLELSPGSGNTSRATPRIPRKFVAAHYLSYHLTPRLRVGLFEATVFNRGKNQFELQYLNPVILYRTVEASIGSPDNVLIGLDGQWDLLRRLRLYGQVMVDEFLFSSLVNPEQKGWWGNKYAIQAGVKYINVAGVDHLDLQLEWNYARPYLYSHGDSLNSYTHYNQPLAHPLWSNFKELVCLVRYQPVPRLVLSARWIHARTGENSMSENWGGLPLLSYNGRLQEYGNVTGQGIASTLNLFAGDVSWQWRHNLFVDLKAILRYKNSVDDTRDLHSQIVSLGLRMNVWPTNADF